MIISTFADDTVVLSTHKNPQTASKDYIGILNNDGADTEL